MSSVKRAPRRAKKSAWPPPFSGPAVFFSAFALLVSLLEAALDPGLNGKFIARTLLAVGSLGTLGVGFEFLVRFLQARQAKVGWSIWAILGCLSFVSIATSAGAFQKLAGKDGGIAFAVIFLAATLGGSITIAGARLCFLPKNKQPHLLRSRPLLLVTLALSLGLIFACRSLTVFAGYVGFSRSLQFFSLILAGLCASAFLSPLRSKKAHLLASAATMASLGAGWLGLFDMAPGDFSSSDNRTLSAQVLDTWAHFSDFDGDGASAYFGQGDCRPDDPTISPRARDIPGNGIDENCNGTDAEAQEPPRPTFPKGSQSDPTRSVVLITIDTVRADRLGIYGASRDAAPFLTQWSKTNRVYENAHSSGGATSLTLSSLLRGVAPRAIEWTPVFALKNFTLLDRNALAQQSEPAVRSFTLPIADAHPTLSELLSQSGMMTAAVVDHGVSQLLSPGGGNDKGFDIYRVVKPPDNDEAVRTAALSVLEQLKTSGRHFFLWVHFYGPHFPDREHPGTPIHGSDQAARYEHEIAHVDRQMEELLRAVEDAGDPLVVITSDHGEHLGPDGRGHGLDSGCVTTHVPLLIHDSQSAPGRIKETVSTVDIAPTVLDALGLPLLAHFAGTSLLRPLKERVVTSDIWRGTKSGDFDLDQTAFIQASQRLVLDRTTSRVTVLDDGDCKSSYPKPLPVSAAPHLLDARRTYDETHGGTVRLK